MPFFVPSLERRRILHVDVTAHPSAAWAAQQNVGAVGPDANVLRLIRDLSYFHNGGTYDQLTGIAPTNMSNSYCYHLSITEGSTSYIYYGGPGYSFLVHLIHEN